MTEHRTTGESSEQLAQRFLDDELSGEERVIFLTRLGKDAALRAHVIDLQQLVLEAKRLPSAVVPASFVAHVLERIEPAPSAWRKFSRSVLAPRQLQWNLASAAGIACLMLTGIWIAARTSNTVAPEASAVTSEVRRGAAVLVRLVVVEPDAQSVQVAGDFNGWNPKLTPLEQASSGAWSVTLSLEPGRYEYQLVINGNRWVADPFAVEQSDDGFGARNAVLEIREPQPAAAVSTVSL